MGDGGRALDNGTKERGTKCGEWQPVAVAVPQSRASTSCTQLDEASVIIPETCSIPAFDTRYALIDLPMILDRGFLLSTYNIYNMHNVLYECKN